MMLDDTAIELHAGEVYVWEARVSKNSTHEHEMSKLLDDDERQRAARFRFASDRTQYVVAHGLLRTILARCVSEAPERLRFETGRWGKPSLSEPVAQRSVEFSLSHSGDYILIAAALDRIVGADVERWAPDIRHDELAESCFSQAERAELAGLPDGDKAAAFFAGWTRKEAYVKALGVGVALGLDYFDVSLAPCPAGIPVTDRRQPSVVRDWSLRDIALAPGYSAAVVAQGRTWQLRRTSIELPGGTGEEH